MYCNKKSINSINQNESWRTAGQILRSIVSVNAAEYPTDFESCDGSDSVNGA